MRERVLITGISGFIGKHVALRLLTDGYQVRGTVRSLARADEVRQTLALHGADLARLSFVEADLESDSGWEEAASGCRYVQHIASPVPIAQPRDREALVPQAKQGTLRVLEAARAADVDHVVVTSSVAAMMYRPDRSNPVTVSEDDWSDPEWAQATAYVVSKTRAELALWQWAHEHDWADRVTTINPSVILGPTLDAHAGSSTEIIRALMTGAYPLLPPLTLLMVDIRDVVELHARAMTMPATGGRRLLGAADALPLTEVAAALSVAFPAYAKQIPTMAAPAFLIRMAARFERTLQTIAPDLGVIPIAETAYVTDLTGVTFRPSMEAVHATAQSLIDHGVV